MLICVESNFQLLSVVVVVVVGGVKGGLCVNECVSENMDGCQCCWHRWCVWSRLSAGFFTLCFLNNFSSV